MPISRTIRGVPVLGLLLLAGFLPGLLAGGENSNWPSFRGPSAVGVMAGQNLPDKWDAGSGVGIRFKVEIPGLAHSSPVIWGDRLFVTTTVSSEWYASFKPGLYGSGEVSRDHRGFPETLTNLTYSFQVL